MRITTKLLENTYLWLHQIPFHVRNILCLLTKCLLTTAGATVLMLLSTPRVKKQKRPLGKFHSWLLSGCKAPLTQAEQRARWPLGELFTLTLRCM